MHVASLLYKEMFSIEVAGKPGSVEDVFPQWQPHDRFGLIIDGPLGGLGATHLLQLAIACFYDARPSRRQERKIYPEIYAFHIGRGWGAHTDFDFWPPRREVILSDDPRDLLTAINDRAITRLAIPERPVRTVDHRPKEVDAALDLLVTTFAYSRTGRVEAPDVVIAGKDRRTEMNPRKVLRPTLLTQALVDAAKRAGRVLKEADPEFGDIQLCRQSEVTAEERDAACAARDALSSAGLVSESYRVLKPLDCVRMF